MGSESQCARQYINNGGRRFQVWRDYSLQKQERWGVRKETEIINTNTSKPVTELGEKLSLSRLQSFSPVQSVMLPANHKFDIFNTITSTRSLWAKLWGAPSRKQVESHLQKQKWTVYSAINLHESTLGYCSFVLYFPFTIFFFFP